MIHIRTFTIKKIDSEDPILYLSGLTGDKLTLQGNVYCIRLCHLHESCLFMYYCFIYRKNRL